MTRKEESFEVNVSTHTSQAPSGDDWHVNLVKDGGRRVMYGGNAYEDDLESAPGPGEQAEHPAPAGGAHAYHE
jgi:hypothetical protein